MVKYAIIPFGVYDNETGLFIPQDEGNRHYKEYLEWVSEGNEPDPMTDEQKAIYE